MMDNNNQDLLEINEQNLIRQLINAINADYYLGVDSILKTSADVYPLLKKRDNEGRTPLLLAIEKERYTIIKLLLTYKICQEERDDEGYTPLHIAVEKGDVKLVKLLLKHKVSVKEKDDEGRTPFHYVCNTKKGINIVPLLLKSGADINEPDNLGWTPLHHAIICEKKTIINYLWNHNKVDRYVYSCEGETPLQLLSSYNIQPLLNNYLKECIDSCIGGAAIHNQVEYCKTVFKTVLLENPKIKKPKEIANPIPLLNELTIAWNSCTQEIKKMQDKKLKGDFSFYDLCLERNPEKLQAFIKDEERISKLETCDLKTSFPNYSSQLIQNLTSFKKLYQKIPNSNISIFEILQEEDNSKLHNYFANLHIKTFLDALELSTQFPDFYKGKLKIVLEKKQVVATQKTNESLFINPENKASVLSIPSY